MKTLQELINLEDPAWPLVQKWIAEARNPVEVLPPISDAKREQSLLAAQVTTRSPMGAIIFETGGVMIDHGWLRILGSGHPRLPRSLPDWNFGQSFLTNDQQPEFLLVADDVAGGFFAIDGGGLGSEKGKVCYFAPDKLAWENTGKGYSDFLIWCLQGDLAKYYETMRWPTWKEDVKRVNGDQAFSIYPLLSTAGGPINERSRRPVSITEMYNFQLGEASRRSEGRASDDKLTMNG